MNKIRQSMLLSVGLILTACLLAAAAAGLHPVRKCYDTAGEQIPCDSNYLQTKEAARATARNSGPSAPTITPSPTASPTATPTATPSPTETPLPSLAQPQQPPPVASASQQTSPQPTAIQLIIPIVLLGCAGVLALGLAYLLFRWFIGRRNAPPGPP